MFEKASGDTPDFFSFTADKILSLLFESIYCNRVDEIIPLSVKENGATGDNRWKRQKHPLSFVSSSETVYMEITYWNCALQGLGRSWQRITWLLGVLPTLHSESLGEIRFLRRWRCGWWRRQATDIEVEIIELKFFTFRERWEIVSFRRMAGVTLNFYYYILQLYEACSKL